MVKTQWAKIRKYFFLIRAPPPPRLERLSLKMEKLQATEFLVQTLYKMIQNCTDKFQFEVMYFQKNIIYTFEGLKVVAFKFCWVDLKIDYLEIAYSIFLFNNNSSNNNNNNDDNNNYKKKTITIIIIIIIIEIRIKIVPLFRTLIAATLSDAWWRRFDGLARWQLGAFSTLKRNLERKKS